MYVMSLVFKNILFFEYFSFHKRVTFAVDFRTFFFLFFFYRNLIKIKNLKKNSP